ncbi:snurportin-1 [Uranotaenia lowii]|uniref:snurportin-1 n=1 Tax=Uranotaenia lowii TaxID=190385 RepID=UPI002479C8C6|nr:snurportin-1 [Uranotaenia lowii]
MTDSDDSTSRFTDLYKNKSRTAADARQSERRRLLLEDQKRLRQTEVDQARPGLLELIEAETGTDSDCSSEAQPRRPRVWYSKLYRDKIQQSEWMHERPDDVDSWFLVPCPVGIRCLLVIRRGLAVAYDKSGRSVTKFTTKLGKKQRVTVLDCFLTKQKVFYVVDMLVYNELDLVQCECQFRFLWIRSKLEEDDVQNRFCMSKEKIYHLKLLPVYDLRDQNQIADCLSRYPMFEEEETRLDGLLFYHKESNYMYGRTPLVTWLFPFMVPDVLGREWGQSLHQQYLENVPPNYDSQNYRSFMDEFDARLEKKRSRRNNGRVTDMESEDDCGGETSNVGFSTEWDQMNTIGETMDDSYEDENWQHRELDEVRRLEMEG